MGRYSCALPLVLVLGVVFPVKASRLNRRAEPAVDALEQMEEQAGDAGELSVSAHHIASKSHAPEGNTVRVWGEGMEACVIEDWLDSWTRVADPSLKFRVIGFGEGAFSKFRAWLRRNSKKYGKQAAKHKCTDIDNDVDGPPTGKCDSFVVVNGKYLKPPNLYPSGPNGAFWGLRRRLFEKLEIWGFDGEGLSYARRILKGKDWEGLYDVWSEWKDGNKFRNQSIHTFKSKSVFKSWLKANTKRWGKKAAKHSTSPFVVVNDRFIGGAKQLREALSYGLCGS